MMKKISEVIALLSQESYRQGPERIRTIKHKYAIAGSYRQYEYWMEYYRLPKDEVRYIQSPADLRGIDYSDSFVFLWGTWQNSDVYQSGRDYLYHLCGMIAVYTLGARCFSKEEGMEFARFCLDRGIPISEETESVDLLGYFLRHCSPYEELSNVKEPN